MHARTTFLTLTGAIVFSLVVWGQQAPSAPSTPPPPPGPPAPFHPHIVATGLRGGYQVVATDMNTTTA